jgi:UTP-glucose-1-phosphate uridylyltransferase
MNFLYLLKNFVKSAKENGFDKISKCSDSYKESIYDELDRYVVLNNTLYEIEKEELGDYFCHSKTNDDGSISFFTQFYNGGTDLTKC